MRQCSRYSSSNYCVRSLSLSSLVTLSLLLLLLEQQQIVVVIAGGTNESGDNVEEESPSYSSSLHSPVPLQTCDYFLAPSKMGWGVYAARNFQENEIIDITPFYVPLTYDDNKRYVKTSILDDYVFGYDYYGFDAVILYGPDLMYNHHPYETNIIYTNLFIGDTNNQPGFTTSRFINAGEQLFVSYGLEDHGKLWFEARQIIMQIPNSKQSNIMNIVDHVNGIDIDTDNDNNNDSNNNDNNQDDINTIIEKYKHLYCSKIYSGIGLPSIRQSRNQWNSFNTETRLASFDAGLYDIKAKTYIHKNERIELSTGLIVSQTLFGGTSIAPLLWTWNDLQYEQRHAIKTLRESNKLIVPKKTNANYWIIQDGFISYEDIAILPHAGNIGMIRRVGGNNGTGTNDDNNNCHLIIHTSEDYQQGGSRVTLELIATRDIAPDEILTLDMPFQPTIREMVALKELLDMTHQPYSREVFYDYMTRHDKEKEERRDIAEEEEEEEDTSGTSDLHAGSEL